MWTMRRSVRWTCWFNAWAGGLVPIDEARDAALGDDAAHDVTGLEASTPTPLLTAWGGLRRRGATAAALVLPAPGDPAGLTGPPSFNEIAIEAGEAVLFPGADLAVVPEVVGRGVFWRLLEARPPRESDAVADAERDLREHLARTARVLTDLDAPRWDPEVRDALSQVRATTNPSLAPGYEPRAEQLAALATRCLSICALASTTGDRIVIAHDARLRDEQITGLERSARHAIVSACNGGLAGLDR